MEEKKMRRVPRRQKVTDYLQENQEQRKPCLKPILNLLVSFYVHFLDQSTFLSYWNSPGLSAMLLSSYSSFSCFPTLGHLQLLFLLCWVLLTCFFHGWLPLILQIFHSSLPSQVRGSSYLLIQSHPLFCSPPIALCSIVLLLPSWSLSNLL